MTVRKIAVAGCVLSMGCLLLAGCNSTLFRAPVIERSPQSARPSPRVISDPRPAFYTVKKGDTLYSIALDFGVDYKELAAWNELADARAIKPGQQLRLRSPGAQVVTAPLSSAPPVTGRAFGSASDTPKSAPKAVKLPYSDQAYAQLTQPTSIKLPAESKTPPVVEQKAAATDSDDEKVLWGLPTIGQRIAAFNEAANIKGIDIAGQAGQPVLASAAGTVLYSGSGIRGYGKLVVIKHNKSYSSIYAHNSAILVKEGQTVVKGQKIAEMGNTDTDRVKLHFEIRKFGKPVDPAQLLPPG
jgi:lipoprotein NlpD